MNNVCMRCISFTLLDDLEGLSVATQPWRVGRNSRGSKGAHVHIKHLGLK